MKDYLYSNYYSQFCVTWIFILLIFLSGCNQGSPLPTDSVMATEKTISTPTDVSTIVPTSTPLYASLTPTITPTSFVTPSITPTFTPEKPQTSLWAEWQLNHTGSTATWSPDGEYIVFSDINIYGLDDQTSMYEIYTLQLVWQVNRSASSLTFSPDGSYLVEASNRIEFLDLDTGDVIDSYLEGNALHHAAFASDSSTLWIGRSWIFGDENAKSEIGVWSDKTKK